MSSIRQQFSIKLIKIRYFVIEFIERLTGKFFTFHTREMYSNNINTTSIYKIDKPFAIIVQGAILVENSFTYDSIKLYQKMYTNSKIILSTWIDESDENLGPFRELGIEIILNYKPTVSDGTNINLQILSSKSGIGRAMELGCKYVLKSRTDQRMYNPNIFAYLISLQKTFPSSVKGQDNRLIFISMNSFKYRLYSISDMFMFGTIEEMFKYWDVKYKDIYNPSVTKNLSIKDWSSERFNEVYLFTEYLIKYNHTLKWTLEDYWDCCKDYITIVDDKVIDLYWHKYKRFSEYKNKTYDYASNAEEMLFNDWLTINIIDTDINEESIQNKEFYSSINDSINTLKRV